VTLSPCIGIGAVYTPKSVFRKRNPQHRFKINKNTVYTRGRRPESEKLDGGNI